MIDSSVYFLALLPFVNFGLSLFNSDTQPYYFILILLVLLKDFRYYLFDRLEIQIFFWGLFATILMLVVNPDVKKSLNLLIVAIASLYFYRHTYSIKTIRIVLIIYSLFFVLWVVLPEIAFTVQSSLVRNINSKILGFRGIPLLAPEAGLYAGTGVLLLELYLLKIPMRLQIVDYLLLILISVSILLSFSGTSIVFLTVFMIFRLYKLKYFILMVPLLFLLPEVLISNFPDSRLAYFLGFLDLNQVNLIFSDASLMYRVSSLSVAFDFFKHNWLGGILSNDIHRELQTIYLTTYYNPSIGMDPEIHMVSGFGYALIYSGLLAVMFYASLLKRFFSFKGLIYFSLCVAFSYSLIYPVSLILLIENSKKKHVWNSRGYIKR